jgi:hypothetical protein
LLDNRSHEESSWDEDLLGIELLDLKDCDIDLSLTGFDLGELERYMAGPEPCWVSPTRMLSPMFPTCRFRCRATAGG